MANKANSQSMVSVDVEIQGITPLLMCAFNPSSLEKSSRKDGVLPRDEAEALAYRMKNGNLCIPSRCIYAAIISAGKFRKLGKKQLSCAKSSVIPGGITILEQNCDLGTKNFEVDSQSVVVPATGGRIMRHRPRLDEWSTKFTMTVNTNFFVSNHNFTVELANDLLTDAGRICGVLAYRPECKGTYGTFMVKKFKIKK